MGVGVFVIGYEILRHLPIETLHILLDIINETWKSDTFPESWREALIISIPKPVKDNFNPLNYKPIALTSCICKTVERMVNERLVWYLEKNGLLAKQQCGYRSNRSTVDHLVRLETFIRDAFIHNQHLVAVFFDLQKAYDTTWKYGILKDLYSMGLRGNLPIFIGNFLSDRIFQIHLSTILSDKIFHQEEGVPINQSIKSSFVKGAGAHPQNAPRRRPSMLWGRLPLRRGRLLSTILHRWSPRQSILSAGLR